MKKSFIFLAIILIVSFLASCKKDPEFSSSEGRVLENGSKKPVPNARIIISKCVGNFNSGGVDCSTADTIYSDAQGKYRYYKELVGDEVYTGIGNYEFFAKKAGYLYQKHIVAMPTRGAISQDIILVPEAWLKLHVKTVNNYNLDDAIDILQILPGGPGPGKNFISAPNIDYTEIYKLSGNDTTTIYWNIEKNNFITNYSKKIYLPALDTTTFNLFF